MMRPLSPDASQPKVVAIGRSACSHHSTAVKHFLFGLRDVPAILARHVTLFLADLTIFPMQTICLLLRNLAFFQLRVDAPVVVLQTIIYLISAWMILFPPSVRPASAGEGRQKRCYLQGGE